MYFDLFNLAFDDGLEVCDDNNFLTGKYDVVHQMFYIYH